MSIRFFVPGIPVPKGSAKGFCLHNSRRVIITQTNRDKQKPWASLIAVIARNAGVEPVRGPVLLSMSFYFPRPKSHYRTGKHVMELRENAPSCHVTKPDLDKLERCVLDALTGVAYLDDSQVSVIGYAGKGYSSERPGCEITVTELMEAGQ